MRNALLMALGVGLASVWLWRVAQSAPADQAPPEPLADCALLHPDTLTATLQPPPTLAEFDAILARLEQIAAQEPAHSRFVHEIANRYLQRFQAMRHTTDLAAAEAWTDRQLAADPTARVALARRAALRIARHDFGPALADAVAADAVALQIDALEELGRDAEAQSLLQNWPPDTFSAQLRHARAADHQGQSEQAAAYLDAALTQARKNSLHPLSLAGLLAQRATLALHNGDTERACTLYAEALTLHPQHVPSLEWLGRWAWHRQQRSLARDLIERAAELAPDAANIAQLAADMARLDQDLSAAARWSRHAAQTRQRWPEWFRLDAARHAATEGDYAIALQLLEQEAQKRRGREWLDAALTIYSLAGDLAQAQRTLAAREQAGVLHPPVAFAAWAHYQRQDDAAAAARLAEPVAEGRIELDPDDWVTFATAQGWR